MAPVDGSMSGCGRLAPRRGEDGRLAAGVETHRSGGSTSLASAFASTPRDDDVDRDVRSAAAEEATEVGGPLSERSHSRGDATHRTQASVFADFAEEEGDGNKDAEAGCESPVRAPIDLSQAGSMMHRLMEKDKSDVDPRDVHKLLPGQLLTSPSLDLNVDLLQRAIAIAAQNELQREQAQKAAGGCAAAKRDEQDGNDGKDQDEPLSPASAPSFEASHNVRSSPRPPSPPRPRARSRRSDREAASPPPPPRMISPIPGWPSPPPHMVHHISPTLGMAPFGGRPVTPPGMYIDQRMSPVPMPVPVSGPYAMMSPPPAVSMAGMPLPWGAYPPQQYGVPGMIPPPIHPVAMEGMPAAARPPKPVRLPMCAPMPIPAGVSPPPPVLHGRTSVPVEMQGGPTPLMVRARSATPELGGSPSPVGGKEKSARRFRSMEAALAWCHVQHSQKQVPVVPKEDVKKLVEFQLSSGKPIRAPWYRPQKDEEEAESQREVESEQEVKSVREVESEQEALTERESQQDPVEPEARPGWVSPPPEEPPRPSTPVAEDPSSDEEHDLAVAQIVVKPQRPVAPLRTAPSRANPAAAAMRMAPMPPMQQMVSSPPADAPPQSASPTRMSAMVATPVRMPTSPTRMSQMMTTPSPVRMSAGRVLPTPQRRCAGALPHYRAEASPRRMMGYTHTPKRTGGHAGHRGSMRRPPPHGTGFFVPAGMVLPA